MDPPRRGLVFFLPVLDPEPAQAEERGFGTGKKSGNQEQRPHREQAKQKLELRTHRAFRKGSKPARGGGTNSPPGPTSRRDRRAAATMPPIRVMGIPVAL